jgi:uncharacterized protein YyaL (SSP411 family)
MAEESNEPVAHPKGPKQPIRWREWSQTAFDEARHASKLILLDLSAEWCHWCHVMDQTTYSDPRVIRMINDDFVPVRVDIDKRPDISDRYNRGGFPTTAFLSDRGESLWGSTYVPPEDMLNVMRAMQEAKDKGEVNAALEQQRMQYLDLSKARDKLESVDAEFVDAIFEDVFAAYDIEWGGFGREPKFPHPAAIDLLIERYSTSKDEELASAVRSTIDHMTEGLYDEIEGGVFRYSVTRDWKVPHYEKMLETNLGFLRNLSRARTALGVERYADTADGVAKYVLDTLRDQDSGGFFSSQDADEEYYKLDRKGREGRPRPKIIKEVFSGLNCRAVSTLIEAGALLGRKDWTEAGVKAWSVTMRDHWDTGLGLLRHSTGTDLYLFDDQVDFLEALLLVAETQSDAESERTLALAADLDKGVGHAFAHSEGGFGDVRREPGAIGKLAEPERSIIANSRWARLISLVGAATFNPAMKENARRILGSFPPKQVQANGIFASDYAYAWDALRLGPKSVEIHGLLDTEPASNEFWIAVKRALNPSVVVLPAKRAMLEVDAPLPFAVVCQDGGCSKEIFEPGELASKLRPALTSQI